MSKETIYEKSVNFAIRIVKLYQYLETEKKEYIMSKQILKSGTSIGANVREAKYGQSKDDFIAKMSIALKEVSETEYWLEVLMKTGYLTEEEYTSISRDCAQIAKLLISIVKSSKQKQEKSKK